MTEQFSMLEVFGALAIISLPFSILMIVWLVGRCQ